MMGEYLVIFLSHFYFILLGIIYRKKFTNFKWYLYLSGYLILFITLGVYSKRFLLFYLSLILYSSVFAIPSFLGIFFIFLFSQVIIPYYWAQVFILFSIFWLVFLKFKKASLFHKTLFFLGAIFFVLLFLPIIYFLFQAYPQELLITFSSKPFQKALNLSILSSTITTLIVFIFGVPLSYFLASFNFKGKKIINALIDLPILFPQTIVGVILLVFLSPKAPLGEFFLSKGIRLTSSIIAIVLAQIFVSSPFLIRTSLNAFKSVDKRLENLSRVLGANSAKTFFKISFPLAFRGIFNGCILTWARSFSESGSLMIIAYYPKTLPIYIYDKFNQFGLKETVPISILGVILVLWIFILLRWLVEEDVSFERVE